MVTFSILCTIIFFLGKRKIRVDDNAVNEITKKLEACNINVSDLSLEVRIFLLATKCNM